ncbi:MULTISPECIES: hypothetical protein [Corallococcus]|uniref:hypothetical protein n=1 Tax=Corallococcus TaxID=83461 RepID=UPI00117DBFDA|nr:MULTISPECIES: hypothetical protein [Corallococcus]NBD09224.1 hypothetical protein [Corallococcus silvisoli]TSC31247.1 hypothetical protein FOF48_11160 [Corallococcus sp. Z5C101001]
MLPLLPLGAVVPLLCATPATPARWGLQWEAAPGCIQAAPLSRAVEERLGRAVFGVMPEVLIHGTLGPEAASGWTARLTLVDARGTILGGREVSTAEPSCAAIEPRLALVIALMIDPDALVSREPQGEASPDEAGTPAPEREPEPVPPPEPPAWTLNDTAQEPAAEEAPAPEGRPWPERSTVSLAATASTGLGDTFAPGLSVAWRGAGAWTWFMRLAMYPHATAKPGAERFELFTASPEAGLCPLSVGGPGWEVSGCATAALSFVSVDHQGSAERTVDLFVRGDAGPRLHVEGRLGRTTALHAGLGATVGWLRPTLSTGVKLGTPLRVGLDVGMSFRGP